MNIVYLEFFISQNFKNPVIWKTLFYSKKPDCKIIRIIIIVFFRYYRIKKINSMRLTTKIIGVLALLVLTSSFRATEKYAVKHAPFDFKGNRILIDSTETDSALVAYIPFKESAHASYYHEKFNGRKTANGEIFDNNLYTAAHKTLKFGTKIRVTNTANDSSVIVTVNDRGPFVKGRELDLSKKAFMEIAKFKLRGYLIVNIDILEDSL